jgi:sugar lactone lactonase YvrE
VAPHGLTISTDGQTLYVADSAADGNGIYILSIDGNTRALLTNTAGTSPRVPAIVSENGQDQLYFSGVADGQPAVFKMGTAGGEATVAEPEIVFQGDPLINPSGVAVAQDGTVYVIDPGTSGVGSVYRIRDGAAEAIAENVHADPDIAGATLTLDESALLVSHLHPQENTAQVLIINLATLEQAIFNKGIAGNPGAGGVHRAHLTGDLAWCGYFPGGGVYFLEP